MRIALLLLASLLLAGCQFDPHAPLYTTSKPKDVDIVGTYVLDSAHLPQELDGDCPEIKVELRADGTFSAKNVPPNAIGEPDVKFFKTLISGTGTWEKESVGTMGWGISLNSAGNHTRFHPAGFTGDKPPYGLIFVLGDPDSGHAVLLRKM